MPTSPANASPATAAPDTDQGSAARPRARRDQTIEALRIISAFGIVVFHAHARGYETGFAGLVVFIAISTMFEGSLNWTRVRSLTALARTLLLPWAFWFVAFALLNRVAHKPVLPGGLSPLGLLAGTSIHLWYLPYMFAVLVLLNLAKQHVTQRWLFRLTVLAGTLALFSAPLWYGQLPALTRPLPQWAQAMPAVLIGLALGLAPLLRAEGLAGLAVLAAAFLYAVAAGLPGFSLPYAVGVAALVLAMAIKRIGLPAWFNVQPVADCMFGVYLVHLLGLTVTNRLLGPSTFAGSALAFAGCLVAVYTARKFVPASRAVLG